MRSVAAVVSLIALLLLASSARAEEVSAEVAALEAPLLAKLEAERDAEKRADLLADLALVAKKHGLHERFAERLDAMRIQGSSEKAIGRTGAVYFEPYRRWVSAEDAQRLLAGGERIEGEWRDKDAVTLLDKKHATWSDPWILRDAVHELRTTVPYRQARALLLHVGAYRAFFLARVAGQWDLRAPKGLLPIVVTETQAQLRAQMKDRAKDVERLNATAYYLQSPRALNPCVATFEPTEASGAKVKVGVEDVLLALQHEVTHQIAYEYSKHDFDATRPGKFQAWSVEGLATFFMGYRLEKTGWRLRHLRRIPVGEGRSTEGDIAWCVENRAKLPALDGFLALTTEKFVKPEQYHFAAVLAYFLLEGEGGKYRQRFLKLLEVVHRVRDTEKTWRECFAKVDSKKLEKELQEFVAKIEVE